jgi:hypothetical protein
MRNLEMKITVPNEDLKEGLEGRLGVKVSKELLKEFISYLEVDLAQWIYDNLKAFEVALKEERRI